MISMLKKILRRLFPGAGARYLYCRAIIRNGTLKPERSLLPILGNPLYADWNEPRGKAILVGNAKGQSSIKKLWRQIVVQYEPDVIIDCGANYGEIVYYSDYKKGSRVFAIEADQRLMPFLEKSRAHHPNAEDISLLNAFVSESASDEIDFFVDKDWSGRSSAFQNYRMNEESLLKTKVKTISIDSLLKNERDFRLLFKIDVEGYEPFVMNGMKETLERCRSAIGIVEYNNKFIQKVGLTSSQYFNELETKFSIYAKQKDRWISVKNNYSKFLEILETENQMTDLLLLTDEGILKFNE